MIIVLKEMLIQNQLERILFAYATQNCMFQQKQQMAEHITSIPKFNLWALLGKDELSTKGTTYLNCLQ